jgi:hypothetical protein
MLPDARKLKVGELWENPYGRLWLVVQELSTTNHWVMGLLLDAGKYGHIKAEPGTLVRLSDDPYAAEDWKRITSRM